MRPTMHLQQLLSQTALDRLPGWWEDIDDDPKWQEYVFVVLSAAYGLVTLVALVQLLRIQRRVPEYGWTTQKVFHLLNAFVCLLRCIVFALRDKVMMAPRSRLWSPAWHASTCRAQHGITIVLSMSSFKLWQLASPPGAAGCQRTA